MPGHFFGVQACMKQVVPVLLYTHFFVHVLEWVLLDSVKFDDSCLEKFNNYFNGIFKFYKPGWQELKEITEMFEDNF